MASAALSKLRKRDCNNMTTRSKTAGPREPIAEPPKQKRPYVKPAFQHEKVFETMALSCGKVAGTQETCRNNRKAS